MSCCYLRQKVGEVFWFRPEGTSAISVVIHMLHCRYSKNSNQIKYTLPCPKREIVNILGSDIVTCGPLFTPNRRLNYA